MVVRGLCELRSEELIEAGSGHRQVRAYGSSSLSGPWDFPSSFFGASDVEGMEGWARRWKGPRSSPTAVPGHLTPFQASDYLTRHKRLSVQLSV